MKKDNSGEIDILEILNEVWRHKRKIIIYAAIGALIGLFFSVASPKEYRTVAKMAPEGVQKSDNGAALAAIAGMNMNSQTEGINVAKYPDVVHSTPFLIALSETKVKGKKMQDSVSLYDYIRNDIKIVWWKKAVGLPANLISAMLSKKGDKNIAGAGINPYRLIPEQEGVFGMIAGRVTVSIDEKSGLITANVLMQDPEISATVCSELINSLKEYITNYRTEKSRSDLDFTQRLFSEAKERYFEASKSYALYSDANMGITKESAKIEGLKLFNEQRIASEVYANLAQRLEAAKIKVQEQTPCFTTMEPARVPVRKANTSTMIMMLAFAFLGGAIVVIRVLFNFVFKGKE